VDARLKNSALVLSILVAATGGCGQSDPPQAKPRAVGPVASAPATASAGRAYTPQPLTFAGDAGALRNTVVVPTLDTPVPPGRNAIWCASFELAWQHLRSDVVNEPVRIAGAEAVAERLNGAPTTEADLPPEAWVALAGRGADGIAGRIREEVAARFPDLPPPAIDPQAALVAYAYLRAAARFTLPFFDNDAEFAFRDGAGGSTAVASFGIRAQDEYAYRGLRKQVRILHAGEPLRDAPGAMRLREFVIDPCRDSSPCQILLAVVPRRDSLATTVALMNELADQKARNEFGPRDVLLIPRMAWRVAQHFAELEGRERHLLNRGFEELWVAQALQTIEFRLDRSGAELGAESKLYCEPKPTRYVFDRPFLLTMQVRGAARPFFVLWVDNAELLTPDGAESQPAGRAGRG
jgi:hypothetical protein